MAKPEINKTRTVKAFVIDEYPDDGYAEPGAVYSSPNFRDHLVFACPGCGRWGAIGAEHPKTSRAWDITAGSLADPMTLTLEPSINFIGCCGWHGYLRNGVFESC